MHNTCTLMTLCRELPACPTYRLETSHKTFMMHSRLMPELNSAASHNRPSWRCAKLDKSAAPISANKAVQVLMQSGRHFEFIDDAPETLVAEDRKR